MSFGISGVGKVGSFEGRHQKSVDQMLYII